MKFILTNLKCVIDVESFCLNSNFINDFIQLKQNKINYLPNSARLTIYPRTFTRIHATGICSQNDLNQITNYLLSQNIRIHKITVNGSFFIVKSFIIPEFHQFVQFCKSYKKKSLIIDCNFFQLEGFLSAIHLKHECLGGLVKIHRKSIIIMGCRKISTVKIYIKYVQELLLSYAYLLNN